MSLLNSQLSQRPLKHVFKRWSYGYRPIQIFAGGAAIALVGFVLFKSGEYFSTAFSQQHKSPYTTENAQQLNKQLKPGEWLKEIQSSHTADAALQTGLYDFQGNVLGTFIGDFQETTPDGKSVITYVSSDNRSYVSQINGAESKALSGVFQGFTPSDQQIITFHQSQSYLYDLSGTPIARLDGLLRWGTLDGQYLVTDVEHGQGFNLYSVDGTLQATYEGSFRGFALHTPQIIATDQMHSYLYDFDGTLVSTFEGEFQDFSPDGKSLTTRSYQSPQPMIQTRLYNLDGTLQARMSGEFDAFTPIESAIIIHTQRPPQSWLYSPEGEQHSVMEGSFLSFTPDSQAFFAYSDGASHLYHIESSLNNRDPSINAKARFDGWLLGMTGNAQRLVTADPMQRGPLQSWLYSSDGTKLADLDGLFIGFISDEQRIVTSQVGSEGLLRLARTTYSIYDLAGNLKAALTGQLLGLTQSGRQGLVMYADGRTRLYDSFEGTEQAVFDGKVLGFTRDETGVFISTEN